MTTTSKDPDRVDEQRLEALLHHFVEDLGAELSYPLVLIGEELGLFRAMAGSGAVRPAGLAELTDTNERYVAEWLAAWPPAATSPTDERARLVRAPIGRPRRS